MFLGPHGGGNHHPNVLQSDITYIIKHIHCTYLSLSTPLRAERLPHKETATAATTGTDTETATTTASVPSYINSLVVIGTDAATTYYM